MYAYIKNIISEHIILWVFVCFKNGKRKKANTKTLICEPISNGLDSVAPPEKYHNTFDVKCFVNRTSEHVFSLT